MCHIQCATFAQNYLLSLLSPNKFSPNKFPPNKFYASHSHSQVSQSRHSHRFTGNFSCLPTSYNKGHTLSCPVLYLLLYLLLYLTLPNLHNTHPTSIKQTPTVKDSLMRHIISPRRSFNKLRSQQEQCTVSLLYSPVIIIIIQSVSTLTLLSASACLFCDIIPVYLYLLLLQCRYTSSIIKVPSTGQHC